MQTPTLFSLPVVESLLPEVAGKAYHKKASMIAREAGYRCQITRYPYPAPKPVPGQKKELTYLMLEPHDTTDDGAPMSAQSIQARLKKHGICSETVRAVCPLVFWSRHVDLALGYGKGELVFAPWLTQGELITVFRTLCIANAQPEADHDIPVVRYAAQILQELSLQMGNDSILKSLLALPETTEWDAPLWIQTIQALPTRERRVYMQRFGRHVRFLPSLDAFSDLGTYWAQTAHETPETLKTGIGNDWVKRFVRLSDVLAEIPAPKKANASRQSKKRA